MNVSPIPPSPLTRPAPLPASSRSGRMAALAVAALCLASLAPLAPGALGTGIADIGAGILGAMALGAVLLAAALLGAGKAAACTRATYLGSDDVVITGRSMDWEEDMRTNLWALPAGISRTGCAGAATPQWTAKYGSVVATAYDVGTADGMNTAGLVANLLYLAESEYAPPAGRPALSIALWAQYALDNFATVAEAVAALSAEPFVVVTASLPNGSGAQLHLSLSDAGGDSAILEYIAGRLVVHHGRQFQVMTNSPCFDAQLALNSYWEQMGGTTFLPGTNRAADRFARATFYIKAIPGKAAPNLLTAVPDQSYVNQAVAGVASVMRAVSVPLGISTPGQPNISSTLWRTVSDQKNKVYFFDSATSPNAFWVPLGDLDLEPGAPVKKLALTGDNFYSGNVAHHFAPAAPFTFMPVAVA